MVKEQQCLLLQGVSGSGKSTLAKHLSFKLATKPFDVGFDATPCYFDVDGTEGLRNALRHEMPKLIKHFRATAFALMLIIDSIERLGNEADTVLAELLNYIDPDQDLKILLLGDSTITTHWSLPSGIIRHNLRPLSLTQRQHAVHHLIKNDPSQDHVGLGTAAELPVNFALALQANSLGETNEDLLDAWLATVAPETDKAQKLAAWAFHVCSGNSADDTISTNIHLPQHFSSKAVQNLLAARHLVDVPLQVAIDLFHSTTTKSESIVRSLIARLGNKSRMLLLQGLLSGSKTQVQLGALLAADFLADASDPRSNISNHMLDIVQEATLPIIYREKAGRILSGLGDPRDLAGLTSIPGGEFQFGSDDHPNSQPVTTISVEGFHTKRGWHSLDGFESETQSLPATDLSWHDARAYCEWLTRRWRSMGKINQDEHVRLPIEPEWERAARGDQRVGGHEQTIYPWGTEWKPDAANYEETAFNKRISVGLFPAGTSPYGCHDMAGQIWEWCSTLWREDMAKPSFQYPWQSDDGRENMNAPGSVRRVLRGGCFSSGKSKATCTYRGSLEPGGFWRGNGFRVVVAPIRS
ncbi:uncharacterized protein RAG0_10975 [Rhynchosporium agropyri]|uniref:Sulfatase-modifying factor enzyme domain-containing protein n=1 Tax=Rhynchosporium agropyri TaxID=914238 RepID=A0A1E1L267_9HELO|nr:uncharacterized protein RAG0_10975 [Rhynchosporium agropyri]